MIAAAPALGARGNFHRAREIANAIGERDGWRQQEFKLRATRAAALRMFGWLVRATPFATLHHVRFLVGKRAAASKESVLCKPAAITI